MREIIFDTETTGVFPDHQEERLRDRIVELGCVEIINLERTGREFHAYLNPDRDVPEEVVRVHGLRLEFLRGHGRFSESVDALLEFVAGAPLVAHNAAFDQSFLNAELRRCGRSPLGDDRFVDTLAIARKRFPGASCSLDALAKRFQLDRYGFDLSARKGAGGHGALIDARILAEVYLNLKGGREQRLAFDDAEVDVKLSAGARPIVLQPRPQRPMPLPALLTPDEAAAHEAFVTSLGEHALWRKHAS